MHACTHSCLSKRKKAEKIRFSLSNKELKQVYDFPSCLESVILSISKIKKSNVLHLTFLLILIIYDIFFFRSCRAVFSSRDTCACEMPISSEISVCVFPS